MDTVLRATMLQNTLGVSSSTTGHHVAEYSRCELIRELSAYIMREDYVEAIEKGIHHASCVSASPFEGKSADRCVTRIYVVVVVVE
jgi:hypothetical protein